MHRIDGLSDKPPGEPDSAFNTFRTHPPPYARDRLVSLSLCHTTPTTPDFRRGRGAVQTVHRLSAFPRPSGGQPIRPPPVAVADT